MKKLFALMTVFSVCLGFAATSQAAASSQVPGPIAYARALCMLDLDDAQNARIAQVFKEHRPEFQTLRQKMQACRQENFRQIQKIIFKPAQKCN